MRNFKIQSRVLGRIKFISTCPSELRAINEWLSEWAQREWLRDLREFESHLAILSCRMRADEETNKKQPKRLLCRKARRNRTNWFFCSGTWQKCEQDDVSQKLQKGEHIQKKFTSPVIMKTFGGEWCVGDVRSDVRSEMWCRGSLLKFRCNFDFINICEFQDQSCFMEFVVDKCAHPRTTPHQKGWRRGSSSHVA